VNVREIFVNVREIFVNVREIFANVREIFANVRNDCHQESTVLLDDDRPGLQMRLRDGGPSRIRP
jgi:hypothetical protein